MTQDVASPPASLSDDESPTLGPSRPHGLSLWQEAWRRLRQNRLALVALGYLGLLAAAALATPVLPLQSPQWQRLTREDQFQPPNLRPVRLAVTARQVQAFEEELDRLWSAVRAADASQRPALQEAWRQRQRQHPLHRYWNAPGPLTRGLLKLRLALFGDWCLPSLCGTDELGRDVLARLAWGARVSLTVGLVATLVSLVIGVTYGAVAGYVGGWLDAAMMRLVDILYSIPFIFIVIFLISVLNEEAIQQRLARYGIGQITVFYLVIGALYWLTMARVVRGQVLSLKHELFVEAARSLGATAPRIIFRHLVPNVLGVVIVYLTLTIPSVMLFEAFLSFLGLGVQPPDVSWGLLVNEGMRVITPIQTYWWLVLFPGLALALTLWALNFLGDGLRDALDPRLRGR
jgi:oligopeptide transport system permease protein